jgi:intracellular multiplication protein IcmP
MAGAPQGGGNQSDNSAGIIWITAAVFIAFGVLWYTFKAQIAGAYFKLKLLEIDVISIFTHNLDDVRVSIIGTNPAQLKFEDIMRVGDAVGDYLRIPCIIIIVALAVIVYLSNSVRTFKRTYEMKDLLEAEQVNWPQIAPVAKLNLVKADIDKGPWAMAMTPMQFCKRHQLLEEFRRGPQEGMTRKEWDRIEVKLKRGQANKIFATQLGALWAGPHKLPPHIKVLYAVFGARLNNDTEAASKMLKQLAASSTSKLDFTGAEELLKKHENTKLVQKAIQPHAYVLTVMASMLEGARQDGVQASADFLWLKPIDRRLWYILNTVGRQTPGAEVAGIFAHWVAEKEADRKLLVPMIEEATNALELALKDVIYRPDEEA